MRASHTVPRIFRGLGLREAGDRSPVEDLKSYVRNRQLLLVLDNFEQVAEAAPLLPSCLPPRLGNRPGLRTGGARDPPERQRTLRSAIAWSRGLLGEGEKALFARLGVFAGGFDLETAVTVFGPEVGPAGGSPEDPGGSVDVLETLGSLVDGSLVRQEIRRP